MLTKKNAENAKNFYCEICDFSTCKKSNFDTHLLTKKHKKAFLFTNEDKKMPIVYEKNAEYICECGKEYKTRQGLFGHKKKCNFEKCVIIENPTDKDKEKELELKDMFLTVVNENKELRSMMIEQQKSMVEQQKTIIEQSKQMTEIIPKIANNNSTTNNNTINNNQRFSINVFLNEKCKDAINMSDFIKSISVSLQQLDFTKTQGLEKGISNVIMENMNKLSLYERPMHCTDTKRETIYIKDNDTWEKDKDKSKLKNVIRKTSNKNYTALTNWTKENPDFMEDDEKQMFYAKAMSTLGKPMDGVDDKIVKKICSNTYLKESLNNED
jgi:predicted phage tail protein